MSNLKISLFWHLQCSEQNLCNSKRFWHILRTPVRKLCSCRFQNTPIFLKSNCRSHLTVQKYLFKTQIIKNLQFWKHFKFLFLWWKSTSVSNTYSKIIYLDQKIRSKQPKIYIFFRIFGENKRITLRWLWVAQDQNPLGHKVFFGNGFRPYPIVLATR